MLKVIGPAAENPAVQESVRRMRRRYHKVALALLERLLVEGAEKGINLEDIERFTESTSSATFRREILIELLVNLHDKSASS